MKTTLAVLIISFAMNAFAHEGHGPSQVLPPHGGVVKEGATLDAELVNSAGVVKIYVLDHKGKTQDVAGIKVLEDKTTLTDAKNKRIDVKVTAQKDHFLVDFKKGTSHRYSLTLSLENQAKENKLQWQIEDQAD